MAKVTDGLRTIAKAQLVPEDEYDFVVRKVVTGMGKDNWERVDCNFVNPPDQGLATRRISHLIGSPDTGDWRGLQEILMAAELEEVPNGDYGPGDTRNLEGVEFRARVYHGTGRRGLEAKLSMIINDEWVTKLMSDDDETPTRRKRAKKAAKKTRRSRRS